MKRALGLAIVAFVVFVAAPSTATAGDIALPAKATTAASAVSAQELLDRIGAEVMLAVARGDTPGAVVAVGGRDAQLVAAYGNRSLDPDVPMTPDTLFDLASVSKVVGTATTTMLLFEDGKLTPEMRVAERFPAFAQQGKGEVTVEDLLTHRSGLQAYEQPAKAEANRGGRSQADALMDHIAGLKPIYERGSNIEYSCLNFLTLARVNELTAGRSQESMLRERIWGPLGMNDTTYLPTDEQRARVAPVFRHQPDGHVMGSVHDPLAYYHGSSDENCSGNAGLFSTASDLGAYCRMILNEGEYEGSRRLLTPHTVNLMTSLHAELPARKGKDGNPPETLRRGWGWMIFHDAPYTHPAAPEGSFFGHMGYTGTMLWLDKNTGRFVVVLTNGVYLHDPPESSPLRKAVVRTMNEAAYGPFPQNADADSQTGS